MAKYHEMIESHLNVSHWPKHLLVRYHWSPDQDSASAPDGLFVLVLTSLIASFATLVSVLFSSRRQIERYDDDDGGPSVHGVDSLDVGVIALTKLLVSLELESSRE